MEHLIQRSVVTIRERFHEPLSLDDLASSAMISKYYFLRLFRRVTGVTPGRFLSAVRLHEAKELLEATSLNVAEISAHVGYGSTGTFSRRFSESVGLSPIQYRRLRHDGPKTSGGHHASGVPCGPITAAGLAGTGSLAGSLSSTEFPHSTVYLGLFSSSILQGHPVATSSATAPGTFHIGDIPPGTWYLHSVAHTAVLSPGSYAGPPLLVDTVGPLHFSGGVRRTADVVIHPSDWTCPPVLYALTQVDPLAEPALAPAPLPVVASMAR